MSVLPMVIEMKEHINPTTEGIVKRAHVYCLITRKYYIISENTVLKESLVFNAGPQGDISNYNEVDGGNFITIEEVLATWNPASFIKYSDDGDMIF